MRTLKFIVEVKARDSLTKGYVEKYIRDAINTWSGSFDPASDAFYGIKVKNITHDKKKKK